MDDKKKETEEKISYKKAFYLLLCLFVLILAVFLTLRYISVRAGSEIETYRAIANQTEYTTAADSEAETPINVNTADESELTKLPGIGEAKARAIIEYRNNYGRITAPEDLLNVDGIGESTLEKMLPYLSFDENN